MLALKKIATKKLAIYLSIIAIMLGGTGAMLYLNNKLTDRSVPATAGRPQVNNFIRAEVISAASQPSPNQASAKPLEAEPKLNQPLEASKFKNKGFDLTIFSSEKFKELRGNTLPLRENLELGKRDPFQPN